MLRSRILTVLDRKLKCQFFNIRATTIASYYNDSTSERKLDSAKLNEFLRRQHVTSQSNMRKFGSWLAVGLATGAIIYCIVEYQRCRNRILVAAKQIRADLPNLSSEQATDLGFYIYHVGVYDLNKYAKGARPAEIIEKLKDIESYPIIHKEMALQLLEDMRVGNLEGAVDTEDMSERCETTQFGEGSLCLVPQVDAKEYRLELTTDDGESLKALSLEELRRYPKDSIVSKIPCKSNPTKNEAGPTWTGVQLRDILRRFKVNKSDYDEVRFECLDASSTSSSKKPDGKTVPMDRILSEPNFDVLLAYEKDGSEISPQHGYPLRVVMPQADGAKNVKWLHRVVLIKRTD